MEQEHGGDKAAGRDGRSGADPVAWQTAGRRARRLSAPAPAPPRGMRSPTTRDCRAAGEARMPCPKRFLRFRPALGRSPAGRAHFGRGGPPGTPADAGRLSREGGAAIIGLSIREKHGAPDGGLTSM